MLFVVGGASLSTVGETIQTGHIFVFGDDVGDRAPHSTAISIGPRLVLGCAHSLLLVSDLEAIPLGSKNAFIYKKYNEDYYVQPGISRADGKFTDAGRVLITLFKFSIENDWALFVRKDNLTFEYYADVDNSMEDQDPSTVMTSLTHLPARILHCPVSLLSNMEYELEFNISCNISAVLIQTQSSHHVKYKGCNLCRGSSGGAVHLNGNKKVIAMHCEAVNEVDFEATDNCKDVVSYIKKKSSSEDNPYTKRIDRNFPTKKSKGCQSETVASLCGGNNGLGSALIICKFKKLMEYIKEGNKSNSTM